MTIKKYIRLWSLLTMIIKKKTMLMNKKNKEYNNSNM